MGRIRVVQWQRLGVAETQGVFSALLRMVTSLASLIYLPTSAVLRTERKKAESQQSAEKGDDGRPRRWTGVDLM